jgi:hypothetical protein
VGSKDLPDDQTLAALDQLAPFQPQDLKILDGYVNGDMNGDVALLYVTGTDLGRTRYGTVELRFVNGQWRSSTAGKWR